MTEYGGLGGGNRDRSPTHRFKGGGSGSAKPPRTGVVRILVIAAVVVAIQGILVGRRRRR